MKIEKKTWPGSFQQILDGKKTFDMRLGDVEYKEGDILVLKEWNPVTGEYTGRVVEKEVKFVAKTKEMKYWSQEEIELYGYQVLGFV
jgi:hypothetical protein